MAERPPPPSRPASAAAAGRRLLRRLGRLAATAVLAAPVAALAQSALPTGGRVVAGSATIGAPSGNALAVTQHSNRAVVDWNSFSIGRPNSVEFQQPGTSTAILKRVTGATASTIAGRLGANGQVYLVNPNGNATTPAGSVTVGGGFVASTLGMTTGDFMAIKTMFTGSGASAPVSEAGTIIARPGGFAALIGGQRDPDRQSLPVRAAADLDRNHERSRQDLWRQRDRRGCCRLYDFRVAGRCSGRARLGGAEDVPAGDMP